MTQTELVNTINQKIRELYQLFQKAEREHNEKIKWRTSGQIFSLLEVGVIIEDNEIEPEWNQVGVEESDDKEYALMWEGAMPEDDTTVLITLTDETIAMTTFDQQYGFDGFVPDEVIAWMPLPLPYQAESEDKNDT